LRSFMTGIASSGPGTARKSVSRPLFTNKAVEDGGRYHAPNYVSRVARRLLFDRRIARRSGRESAEWQADNIVGRRRLCRRHSPVPDRRPTVSGWPGDCCSKGRLARGSGGFDRSRLEGGFRVGMSRNRHSARALAGQQQQSPGHVETVSEGVRTSPTVVSAAADSIVGDRISVQPSVIFPPVVVGR